VGAVVFTGVLRAVVVDAVAGSWLMPRTVTRGGVVRTGVETDVIRGAAPVSPAEDPQPAAAIGCRRTAAKPHAARKTRLFMSHLFSFESVGITFPAISPL
jgi:hypothetical protein